MTYTMSKPKSWSGTCLVLLSAAGVLAGCATTQEDPSAPQACVVVDNEMGAGTHSRIFLVSLLGGWRLGMGEVGMGGKLEFCTRRVRAPERARIVIERPFAGGYTMRRGRVWVSPEFALALDEVWTWDLESDRMSRAIVFR